MVTEAFETLENKAASVADRIAEGARRAGHLAKDAREAGFRVTEAVEDGVRAARRVARQGRLGVEDFRDDVVTSVRRAPLAAVGLTFVAGLASGLAVGLLLPRRRDPGNR